MTAHRTRHLPDGPRTPAARLSTLKLAAITTLGAAYVTGIVCAAALVPNPDLVALVAFLGLLGVLGPTAAVAVIDGREDR